MQLDVSELRDFYLTPLGRVTREIISAEIRALWPRADGEHVVGLGHTTPYLRPFLGVAERVVALMPAAEGVFHWPREGPNITALSYESSLPLSDNSVDKILLIHILEATSDTHALLREVWRVLVPTGRLLVVVPYRSGAWARADNTPFGIGRPFSRFQLCQLLEAALLEPREMRRFLCVPPTQRRLILRSTRGWERFGRRAFPRFAGLLAIDAQKSVTAGIPAMRKARSLRLVMPGLAPVPKPIASRTRPLDHAANRLSIL
ncbi:MAG: methyltransferase domain-containing protein [Pseudomonadota bacterium]